MALPITPQLRVGEWVRYKRDVLVTRPAGMRNEFRIKCSYGSQYYLLDKGIGMSCPCGRHSWAAYEHMLERIPNAELPAYAVHSFAGLDMALPPLPPLMKSYDWDRRYIDDLIREYRGFSYGSASIINKPKTTMEITREKVSLFFKSEPAKTFIKAGIMNSDETLTNEGKALFIDYLFQQNADAFKTAVVDPILAEKKEEKS